MKYGKSRLVVLALAVLFLSNHLAGNVAARETKKDEAERYIKVLKTSKDTKARSDAFLKLGELSQISVELAKPAIPLYMDALKDKEGVVRAAAAEGIGMIDVDDKKEVIKALIDIVKNDKVEKVKEGAAKGLGWIGTDAKEAIPALKEAQKAAMDANKKQDANIYRDAMAKINKKK